MKRIIKKDILDLCEKHHISSTNFENRVADVLFGFLEAKEQELEEEKKIFKEDAKEIDKEINKMWREFATLMKKYGYDLQR